MIGEFAEGSWSQKQGTDLTCHGEAFFKAAGYAAAMACLNDGTAGSNPTPADRVVFFGSSQTEELPDQGEKSGEKSRVSPGLPRFVLNRPRAARLGRRGCPVVKPSRVGNDGGWAWLAWPGRKARKRPNLDQLAGF
eukprot:s2069_g5.t1